jgi:excisionase family DNA binding protein
MKTIPFYDRLTCTVEEAIKGTGIGKTRLYELMNAGSLSSKKLGRARLIHMWSLKRLLGLEQQLV